MDDSVQAVRPAVTGCNKWPTEKDGPKQRRFWCKFSVFNYVMEKYSQSLFVGLINAAESFEEYVYLAHGIYIDVYPMNYREQD